ncbi:hypothetical protein D9M70_639260 [compost metagenome]
MEAQRDAALHGIAGHQIELSEIGYELQHRAHLNVLKIQRQLVAAIPIRFVNAVHRVNDRLGGRRQQRKTQHETEGGKNPVHCLASTMSARSRRWIAVARARRFRHRQRFPADRPGFH